MEQLIILGFTFVLIVFGFRFYFYKKMLERVCSLDPDNEYCKKHYQRSLDKNDNPYKNCDVVQGVTPSGGVKTVICYVNDHNKMVKKERATKVLVREFDEKNHPVYEAWAPMEEK